jgi:cytoplasmic iron level regulating protein YaaA (DUF328/UPF0246 family)
MFILFAPSEDKREGGKQLFHPSSLLFGLENSRDEILDGYSKVISEQNPKQLQELFGIKDPVKYNRFLEPLDNGRCLKAIERYDGVAYEYLSYLTLSAEGQGYLDDRVIIFSNLFGPIKAYDQIPDYKFKQGASLENLLPEKFYKKYFSDPMDKIIGNDEVLDLRAGFYDKFYLPQYKYTTVKFLKEGKVVSHWAKAYRGIVLRECALHHIESLEMVEKHLFVGLELIDKVCVKNKSELIFSIL